MYIITHTIDHNNNNNNDDKVNNEGDMIHPIA